MDAVATICDSRKGGDTVTAVALQATPLHTVIWLAANENLKTRTTLYLQRVISALVKVTPETRARVSNEVLDSIIEFCHSRLNYYRKELSRELPRCLSKIQLSEGVFSSFHYMLNPHAFTEQTDV